MNDGEFTYLSEEEMEKLRQKCREELECGSAISYLVGCIYGLFQDYLISEDQEIELYILVDPQDDYNECSRYWEIIEENVLEECIGGKHGKGKGDF